MSWTMDKRKGAQVSRMKNNPVKKNMDKFHKPRTHRDKTKYNRKKEAEEIDRMIDEGGPSYSETMQDELEPIVK